MTYITEDTPAHMRQAAPTEHDFRRYSVGAEAAREALLLGYSEAELSALARRAARFTDPVATHRVQNLALQIHDDTILSVWALAI